MSSDQPTPRPSPRGDHARSTAPAAERRRQLRVRVRSRWAVAVWHEHGAGGAVLANVSVDGLALLVRDGFPKLPSGAAILIDVADPDGVRVAHQVRIRLVGEGADRRGRLLRGRFLDGDGEALVRAIWAYGVRRSAA